MMNLSGKAYGLRCRLYHRSKLIIASVGLRLSVEFRHGAIRVPIQKSRKF